MNKLTKTGLISLAAAIAVAVAPQAAFAAKKKAKPHHHHVVHTYKHGKVGHRVTTHAGAYERVAAPSYATEGEVAALRAELAQLRAQAKSGDAANAQKIASTEQKLDTAVADIEKHEKTHHDLLFFRGGYAHMTHHRHDELLTSNAILGDGTVIPNETNGGDGWYVGAGFDHRLTDDLWGISDIAAVDGEVMFEYKNFGQSTNTLVAAASTAVGPVGTLGTIKNQITQFTLTAAPKIKFNQFGDFRPWIIPFGLGIHVISPPSSGVTVLNPGLMLGAGAEYRIWKDLYAGLDFRYHFTGNDLHQRNVVGLNGVPVVQLNGMSTDGLTAGGYIGFGF